MQDILVVGEAEVPSDPPDDGLGRPDHMLALGNLRIEFGLRNGANLKRRESTDEVVPFSHNRGGKLMECKLRDL